MGGNELRHGWMPDGDISHALIGTHAAESKQHRLDDLRMRLRVVMGQPQRSRVSDGQRDQDAFRLVFHKGIHRIAFGVAAAQVMPRRRIVEGCASEKYGCGESILRGTRRGEQQAGKQDYFHSAEVN